MHLNSLWCGRIGVFGVQTDLNVTYAAMSIA